ncbi:hypothetical protein [Paraburkholderia sp. D1E]|uniref:hypothetical protein n=1 Tax=Paraburkholderia sp. D1E TaxID=3461398 RepID=UPI00404605D2
MTLPVRARYPDVCAAANEHDIAVSGSRDIHVVRFRQYLFCHDRPHDRELARCWRGRDYHVGAFGFLLAWFRPKALPAAYAGEITEMVGLIVILVDTTYIGLGVALDRDELRALRLVKSGKEPVRDYVPAMLEKASYKFNEGMFIILLGTICLCFKIAISIAHVEENKLVECKAVKLNSKSSLSEKQSDQKFFCVLDGK